ncbi:MAG TPA: hypothetical protein VGR54_07180 [Nitrosopumilaceae archaeon]|nr:hypothetical protein [Nitrosopumilaceae archaeon]
MLANPIDARRALVIVAIEKTLLDTSRFTYDQVQDMLYYKYHCYFANCVDHPEYLIDILREVLGNSFVNVVKSIHNNLEEFAYQQPVSEFLVALGA